MKNCLLLLLTLMLCTAAAQNVQPSNTYVRTCLSDIECSSLNSSSYVFYDRLKGDFYIMIDFNKLKTGVDSIDFWLEDLDDTYFYFKASLPPENLPHLSNFNRKTLRLSGQGFMNAVWKPMTLDIAVFMAEDDMQNTTIDANNINAYKVNFNFQIVPKEFNIHKKPHRLTNTIFVGVASGHLNALQPGMEGLLGEAYRHSN